MTRTDSAGPPERKRGSGVRLVHDFLRDEILNLELPPGSPLIREGACGDDRRD